MSSMVYDIMYTNRTHTELHCALVFLITYSYMYSSLYGEGNAHITQPVDKYYPL